MKIKELTSNGVGNDASRDFQRPTTKLSILGKDGHEFTLSKTS
ncbi:hypothetical protein [Listeria monocytogenes]|nr:hypothetical protein [Listeria monocytogenes]